MPPDNPNHDDLINQIRLHRESARRRLQEMEGESTTGDRFLEDGKKRISQSNTGNILHIHKLMRYGLSTLFFVAVASVVFIILMLGWLIISYIYDVVNCPEELQALLTQIWTVLSGAFVVVFFQFVAGIGKKISKNDDT